MSSDSAYLNLPLRSPEQARSDIERDTDALDRWRERARIWQAQQELNAPSAYDCNVLCRAIVGGGT